MNETLSTRDGRPVLRIERRLNHRPEKVWRAITDREHLSQWYPFAALEMDLRQGGKIRFDDGAGTIMDADIVEYDPPRVFAFSEHAPEQVARESDDLVRFELRPDGAGCLLIFTHVFDDRPAAASYATGWNVCFDALDAVLAGEPVPTDRPAVERHEAFVKEFGLDAGSAEVTDSGWQVRFERQLRHPVDQVWAALTGGAPAVGDPAPVLATTAGVPAGVVAAVEAPALLEYALSDGAEGRVRWELSDGPGGARLVLTHSGPNSVAEGGNSVLTAWHDHIEALAARLGSAAASV